MIAIGLPVISYTTNWESFLFWLLLCAINFYNYPMQIYVACIGKRLITVAELNNKTICANCRWTKCSKQLCSDGSSSCIDTCSVGDISFRSHCYRSSIICCLRRTKVSCLLICWRYLKKFFLSTNNNYEILLLKWNFI